MNIIDLKRSKKQNNALHLLFGLIALAYNSDGILHEWEDNGKIFTSRWNKMLIKEYLWRPIQFHITGKISTKDLTTEEIDEIFECINDFSAQRNISVQFPTDFEKWMNTRAKIIRNYDE